MNGAAFRKGLGFVTALAALLASAGFAQAAVLPSGGSGSPSLGAPQGTDIACSTPYVGYFVPQFSQVCGLVWAYGCDIPWQLARGVPVAGPYVAFVIGDAACLPIA